MSADDTTATTPASLAGETTLDRVRLRRVLQEMPDTKSVFVLASVIGFPDQDAIVTLERKRFVEPLVSQMLGGGDGDDDGGGGTNDGGGSSTQLQLDEHNDIYYQYTGVCASAAANEIKVKIIFPATAQHIAKYSQQQHYILRETPHLHNTVTRPYLDERGTKGLGWVYNILDHKAEADRIVFEDVDEHNGFVLLPDFKWDPTDVGSLYCVAIVRDRSIRSLRDLTAQHLPLLRNIVAAGTSAIAKRYGLADARNLLRVFVHYLPSYYHFHVHFTHANRVTPSSGMLVGRAVLLETGLPVAGLYLKGYAAVEREPD
eukprot:TRINITY_DN1754_c0_g1_i12.p1 TRINITY_DN1754_c0_g1~~TRINITY_DN1754_c0_g1_i12.p1  ORF type:complete len:316 (-),score=65.22 TRINITY_DN1754_c0_g1_i12:605-1552(-)